MRLPHRWLLLSIFAAAILIVLTMLGSRRTVHPMVAISFLGYTNMPNAKVRSAVFVLHSERSGSIHVSSPSVELEPLDWYTHGRILIPNRMPTGQNSGRGYEWLFIVDEPMMSGKWRAAWLVYHPTVRGSLLEFAAAHRLLPTYRLIPLLTHQGPSVWFNCVTNRSIWLTNSLTLGLP